MLYFEADTSALVPYINYVEIYYTSKFANAFILIAFADTTGSTKMAVPSQKKTLSVIADPENIWARLPGPLHTIPPLEQLKYQIVPWDPNNSHHPSRFMPDKLLIKSFCTPDYYYWINCSNSDPQDVLRSLGITPKYPHSPAGSRPPRSSIVPSTTPLPQPAQAKDYSERQSSHTTSYNGIESVSQKRGSISPEQEGRNVRGKFDSRSGQRI